MGYKAWRVPLAGEYSSSDLPLDFLLAYRFFRPIESRFVSTSRALLSFRSSRRGSSSRVNAPLSHRRFYSASSVASPEPIVWSTSLRAAGKPPCIYATLSRSRVSASAVNETSIRLLAEVNTRRRFAKMARGSEAEVT